MQRQFRGLDRIRLERRPVVGDISVLIPTLGRAILEESLYWIAAGSAWAGSLIVVDQGQSPRVLGWIERLRAQGINAEYLPSRRRGRAAGINCGLEIVKTRFVAITDDDCFVEHDWLRLMATLLQQHPKAIVTGRVEAASPAVAVTATSSRPAVYRRPRLQFDAMSGGNMGVSLEVVQRVGLFDEDPRLRTAEDGEWAYRALRAGVALVYAPEVGVRHASWRQEAERETQYRDYAFSHGGFYGKYLRQGDWFIGLRALVHHLRALKRWLRGLLVGDREAARHGRAYFFGLLPGILAGMRRQEPD